MNIVCATDNIFVQHCCIMMTSLLCNNKDVDIYVLTEGLTDFNRKIIEEEVSDKGGRVHFCLVDSGIIDNLPLSKIEGLSHISKATYYRLLLPSILKDIDKVIYLDCDIVVNGSLDELWNTNLDNYAIGAVLQIGHGIEAVRLGYPISYGYFNAGVCIQNLEYCRKNQIAEKMFKYAEEHIGELLYNDQDILNAVLYDKCIHLSPRWNMTSMAYDININHRGDKVEGKVVNDYRNEKCIINEYKKHPTVLHYVSKPKPWQKGCYHPLSRLYYDYSKMTIHFSSIKQEPFIFREFAVLKYKVRCFLSNIKQHFLSTDTTRI